MRVAAGIMTMSRQITLRHIEHSPGVEDAVRTGIAGLEKRFSGILGCHVTVEAPHRQRRPDAPFTVRLDLSLPGRDFSVTQNHHQDVYAALREAFRAAGRRLQIHARQTLHGSSGTHDAGLSATRAQRSH